MIVEMPDGTKVSFPDDMPKEQIKGLIASKFPEVAQPQEKPHDVQSILNRMYELGPAESASRIGGGLVDAAKSLATGIVESGKSAITAPSRALTGELRMTDESGRTSDEGIAEGFNMATWVNPASVAMGTGKQIARNFTRANPSEGAQVAQAAKDIGVTLPRAVTSDSGSINQLGKTVANIPLAGQPLRAASKTAIKQMDDAATGVQTSLGTGKAEVAGNRIRQDMASFAKIEEPEQVSALYKKVDNLVDPNVRIPLSETRRIAQNIAARRAASKLEGSSAVDFVADALNTKGMSYDEIKNLRTAVGELKKNRSELANRKISDTEIEAIYSGLSTDLANAVRQSDRTYNAAKQRALGPSREAEEALNSHKINPDRQLPHDNYLRDLGREAKYLYRETNDEGLEKFLWGNLNTLGGQPRMYWADVPDLARGQLDNQGVLLISKADGIEGKLNLSKPMSRLTYGSGAEYESVAGAGLDKIAGVLVRPGHELPTHMKNLLGKNFTPKETKDGILWSRKPGEFIPPAKNEASAAFAEANTRAKTFARDKEALNKVLGQGSDENITSRLIALAGNTSRANLKDLMLAKSKVSKETWDELASAALNDMGRDPSGAFTPDRFVTSWGKMSDSGKRLIFGQNPQHLKALDDLATVSTRFKKLNEYANPSGTAQSLLAGSFGTSLYVAPMSTISSVIGANVAARLLAKPASAKAVADYAKAYEAAVKMPGKTSQNALANKAKALALVAANGNEVGASNLAAKLATVQQTAADQEDGEQVRGPEGNPEPAQSSQQFNDAYLQGRAF